MWQSSIDETNGYDPDDELTFEAPKIETGFHDEWCVDHRGNQYVKKHLTYRPPPNSRRWRMVGKPDPRLEDGEELIG